MNLASQFELLCDRCSDTIRSPTWFSLLVAVTLVCLGSFSIEADPDLFHRLAMGKLLAEGSSFPYSDPFAFTPKLSQWIDHEWLSGVVFFSLYSYGGEAALLIFRSLIYLSTIGILIRILLLLSTPSPTTAAWFLVCMLHGSFGWASVVRCQVFTYLFIPLIVLGILRAHLKHRWSILYVSPLIMIPWCNLHGGFVLGILLTLGFSCFLLITQGRWKRPLLVSLAMIAATALNPYGFTSYWAYLFNALSMKRPTVLEWAPLWEQPDQCVATVLLTVLFFFGVALSSRRKGALTNGGYVLSGTTTLLLSGLISFSAYCAFRHSRLLVFYMVLLAPLGAPFFDSITQRCIELVPSFSKKLGRVWSLTLPSIVLCCIAMVLSQTKDKFISLNYSKFPTAAISHLLASSREGRLLVSFNIGSYALWKLYPKFLISMDGRYETVYPDSTVEMIEEAIATGNPSMVDAINPTDILIIKDESTPATLSKLSDKWEIWYEDTKSILLKLRE